MHECFSCGRNDVRLYRYSYIVTLRPDYIRCWGCIPNLSRKWYVPLIVDDDGAAYGITSDIPREHKEAFYSKGDSV